MPTAESMARFTLLTLSLLVGPSQAFTPPHVGYWSSRDRDDENEDENNISIYHLLSVYYAQGTMRGTLHALSHLMNMITL